MNIMELGAIGELVGGVAVIATLAYLAVQIRQSNNLEKAESARTLTRSYVDVTQRCDMALLRRGLLRFDAMDADDKHRFHALMVSYLWLLQTEFSLNEAALTERGLFESNAQVMESWIRTPGGGAWWQQARETFEPGFRDYIDRLAQEHRNQPAFHQILPWLGEELEGQA